MPEFRFEVFELGEAEPAEILTLPHRQAVWGYVEALALRLRDRNGAIIRVRNRQGELIVRAGVSTALASIQSCRCEDCPLKKELRHLGASHRRITHELHVDCALMSSSLAA
jgi:hypothetical protein